MFALSNGRLRFSAKLRVDYGRPARKASGGAVAADCRQRNFIAHGYEDVVSERLWLVATAELPRLAEQLEEIIRSIPRQS